MRSPSAAWAPTQHLEHAALWLLPWRTLARHARRRLSTAGPTTWRAITGTAEAFAFIPVHPLVEEPGDAGTRLLRLQPRVDAADFDHCPTST